MMQNYLALNTGREFSITRDPNTTSLLRDPTPTPLNYHPPPATTEPSPLVTWSLSFPALSKMAFRSRVGPILRSSLSAVRTAVTRRALTSQSKDGASSFCFAGPLLIGASAATAGLFAATQLYKNNFFLIGNVHAASKVQHLDKYLFRFQR